MKTLKSFYLLTFSTLLILAACSKDEGTDTPQNLTVEQTEYTLEAIDNRSATLSFTASSGWALTVSGENADWLTVTPAIGTAGSKTVELTAAPQITEESRTAYVDIVCGEQTVQITVIQTGAAADADFTALFDPAFAEILELEGYISDAGRITRHDMETIAGIIELEIIGTPDDSAPTTELRGIEFFESLKLLACVKTPWATLDVSGCSALEAIYCQSTEFTTLNANGCTTLQDLDCNWNILTSLNVGGCTALQRLTCEGNRLTSLNVSSCTALTALNCNDNQLPTLDLSHCTALQNLDCSNNSMTTLDITQCTALKELHCYDNLFTGLDISQNRELSYLACEGNPGSGFFTFPISAWFDNDTQPESLSINYLSWVYNGTWEIAIDFQKAE